jgi:ribosome-associated translation inhibitor RaiA
MSAESGGQATGSRPSIDLAVEGSIPAAEIEAARREIEKLSRYVDEPPVSIRVTLRFEARASKRRYIADADLRYQGRRLAAHATGESAVHAAEEVAERLRRQLRRVAGKDVALRNEPRVIRDALAGLPLLREHRPQARLKPPELRKIVHRRTYTSLPLSTLEAANELLDIDAEFLLFRHARTGEDVVVYRRDDGRIGLLHPPGSKLADENDVVVPEESRYSEPITFEQARTEMDFLNHRFLYFVDAEDGRGKVIYLRHDGDYGLVEPE